MSENELIYCLFHFIKYTIRSHSVVVNYLERQTDREREQNIGEVEQNRSRGELCDFGGIPKLVNVAFMKQLMKQYSKIY